MNEEERQNNEVWKQEPSRPRWLPVQLLLLLYLPFQWLAIAINLIEDDTVLH